MICVDLFLTLFKEGAGWILTWAVFAPVITGIATSLYYRNRYREGICNQRYYDQGLFKD